MSTADGPVLCTPLWVEQVAVRRGGRGMRLLRTGMGPRRASAAAATLAAGTGPVLLAGVAGSLAPQVHPGDVVVAGEVRDATRRVEIPSAPLLAGALRGLGLRRTVHLGPIISSSRIAEGGDRQRWVGGDSLAVDMESIQLCRGGVPLAVVRSIVDSAEHPMWRPGTVWRGMSALRALRGCVPALRQWAAATGPREVLLASPGGAARTDRRHAVHAVRALAAQVELMLVIGSRNSSNSHRLVEAAEREGVAAHLVDDPGEIDLRWLPGRTRLGITADAAAPAQLVDRVVHCLGGLGPVRVRESRLPGEDPTFALPREVS